MTELDRRAFLRLAGAGVALLGAGACNPARKPPGGGTGTTVTVPGLDPRTLAPVARPTVRLGESALGFPSPFGYIANPGYRQMSLIYDTLMWKDNGGKPYPWLASTVERSDDNLVYTFELRDGVKWHDGRPLTADDVVFTFDYYSRQSLGPLVVHTPRGIDKVVAKGDRRVEIHLERPDVTFLETQAGTIPIAPRHIWERIDDPGAVQDLAKLVGTGPYRLASYASDSEPLSYDAHDGYFLGRPFVKRIEMVGEADDLTALLAGQVDAAEANFEGTRPEALAPFRNNPAFGIIDESGGFAFPLYWNLGRGGALADVRFRRACAMAIDRSDVVQRLTGGNGVPGNAGFLAPTNPFHVEVEQYAFDRQAADRLLDEAGYSRSTGDGVRRAPDGKELRFELLLPNLIVPAAEVVKQSLKEIGVELTLRAAELGPAVYGKKLAGDYDMFLGLFPGPSGAGTNADPDLLRPLFSSKVAKGFNSANGFVDREFDDLAERQLAAFDEEERRRMVGRMQEILAREIPALPLYYSTVFTVFRSQVFDQWYLTPGGFPVSGFNRQAFVTGVKQGTVIRPSL